MIDNLLVLFGMWNVTDGWFSISLYLNDPKQTWGKDHYIRVIRMAVGVALIVFGFIGG